MVDTYRDHVRQRLRSDESKGYLDYLIEQVDRDRHGGRTVDDRAAQAALWAPLFAQFAFGAGQSHQVNPNRKPGNVRIQYSGQPAGGGPVAMAGLFGGGEQTARPTATPYVPDRAVVAPPGWEPTTVSYEDASYGVPGAHQDPMLMLLQEWINQRFPNDGR